MNDLERTVIDHPCKETCSGWKQGFERGEASASQELELCRERLGPAGVQMLMDLKNGVKEAEARGFQRAVELLRSDRTSLTWGPVHCADWLEGQK